MQGINPGQWRLARVEIVNWGTFPGHHRIDVAREGFLLTGHSGSGKSSLVDAVAAVLTPPSDLRFNAAAASVAGGTGRGDRSVASYVRGAWRHRTDEATGEAVADTLRPSTTWSGVLLRYEDGAGHAATLVRLMLLRRGSDRVADLFVHQPGEADLLDLEPFVRTGLDAPGLRKHLPEATVSDRHAAFAGAFSERLGVGDPSALVLLHRTQSAKNLGSLDDLFRDYMLDEPITFGLAEAAAQQFAEVTRAHARIDDARRQLEALDRLVPLCRQYDDGARSAVQAATLRGSLEPYRDMVKLELAAAALADAQRSEDTAANDREAAEAELEQAVSAHRQAVSVAQVRGGQAMATQGDRLQRAGEIAALVRSRRSELAADLQSVGLTPPESFAEFSALRELARTELAAAGGDAVTGATPVLTGPAAQMRKAHEARAAVVAEHARISAQVQALRTSRSNLPAELIAARRKLCEVTGIAESALRFAAELLRVRSGQEQWAGAIEKVLRPLATILLVPAAYQDVVREAVASSSGIDLEFQVVGVRADAPRAASHPDSLIHKVEVADVPGAPWLHHRLSDFDYRCVAGTEDFDDVERAVTPAGQVKHAGDHLAVHDAADPGARILGDDITDKLDHLLGQARDVQARLTAAEDAVAAATNAERDRLQRVFALRQVQRREWHDVDIESAEQNLAEAQRTFDSLLTGTQDLATAEHDVEEAEERLSAARVTAAVAADVLAEARAARRAIERVVEQLRGASAPDAIPDAHREELEGRYAQVRRTVTHDVVDEVSLAVSRTLDGEREAGLRSSGAAEREITGLLAEFRRSWPALTRDLGAGVGDRARYLELAESVRTRRLPELEAELEQMLAGVAQRALDRLAAEIRQAPGVIRERIVPVNDSLRRSEYAPGRFLEIRVREQQPAAVREFLDALDGLATDRAAALPRLEAVMRRLGSADPADRAWRTLCLDTRRHVRFTGVELDASGMTLDVHDSSAGLSGGQRQKLVVFCLAAALRYRLATLPDGTPAYGSVILDEAFDKADTEFTRTAMDTFRDFGFHMILATPLKLLQTLERYVGGVGLATCQDGKDSRIDVVTLSAAPVPDGEAVPSARR
ncbi:ATP-binding protein [Myceligenerans crystallogenes]